MIVVREDNLASLCELKVGDILAQSYNKRAIVIQADNEKKLWQYEIVGGSVITIDKEDPLFKIPFTIIAHNTSIEEARKSGLVNFNKDIVTFVKELNTENGHIKFNQTCHLKKVKKFGILYLSNPVILGMKDMDLITT